MSRAVRRRGRPPARLAAAALAGAAAVLAGGGATSGCASGPPVVRTTFLQSVDLVEMTDRMAASLAEAPAITDRTPDSPRWVVSMDRIVNRTNQVIPDGQKWLYVARLRGLLARTDLAREASIMWVMPPAQWSRVAGELDDPREPLELRTPPTHQLTGTFLAQTLTSAAGRSDTYVCSYQLIDLSDGSLVWEDAWEVKRSIAGRTYD